MKNIFTSLLLGAVLAFSLTGCEKEEETRTPEPEKKVFSYQYSDGRPYTEAKQMIAAAEYGDIEHMQTLHEQGVDLSVQAGIGNNLALIVATKYKQAEAIRYLLDNGVDPDSVDGRGSGALGRAVWKGWLDGVKLLIERGASANGPVVEDYFTMPPYFSALYLGKLGIARFLLDNGADGAYKARDGYTALFAAIDKYPALQRYIPSPFAEHSNLAAVKFAVANGADIHAVYHASRDSDLTPLIMAAVYQNRDVYDYLVSLGVNPDEKDSYGNAPAEYMDGVRAHPAYLFREFYKDEALLRAIRPDAPLKKIILLVEQGADVNKSYHNSYTPLILAAVYRRQDIYDYLLANGADANEQDRDDNRAMDYLAGGKKHAGSLFEPYYAQVAAPKRRSDEKPHDYLVRLNYSAGNPVRIFINGSLANSADGEGRGFIAATCKDYLVAGENKVRISWGRMPGEPGWDEALARYVDPSDVHLLFEAKYDKEGNDTETVFEKQLTLADAMTLEGVLAPAYEFSFHTDFSSAFNNALAQAEICNSTPEDADANIVLMRAFARDAYTNLRSGNLDWLVQKSRLRLEIAAASSERPLEEEAASYRRALAEARKEGLAYALESDEQIVLLPSFDGKLWQIVIMASTETGAQLMHEVKMQAEASPKYDYNLIQTRAEGGLSMTIPCRIAKVNGAFVIVR